MVHKAAAVRALRVAECTRRVRAAHHTVRARAVCIRVTTRAPARTAPSHTQASTASRQAGHATRPRRAPTRARGAERTDDGPHARWLAPPGADPDAAPGLAAAVSHGRARGAHAPFPNQPHPPPSHTLRGSYPFTHTTTTSPNPQNIITTPQHPKFKRTNPGKNFPHHFFSPPPTTSRTSCATRHVGNTRP